MTFKESIKDYFNPGTRIHMVGVGGVSMSPLALVLNKAGFNITGSDMTESNNVGRLREAGIPVTIGHFPTNVEGADCIIRSSAIHDDNPEIIAARNSGIPVFERAEAWGEIMKRYNNALCVSGTHGKTTTTSMCTHILMSADKDPSVMIGGDLPLLGSGYRVGEGDTIVLEACEYYDSFLSFFPTIALILQVDADHLDYFEDLEAIKTSFRHFAELVPSDGYVIADSDCENTMDALRGLSRNIITFGVEAGDVHAANLVSNNGYYSFDIIAHDKYYTHVNLTVPGLHNVSNALAASAAAYCLGISGEFVTEGLESFRGASRRFERKGTYEGSDVYDDYAHHPQELRALYAAVSELEYKRIIWAFQPHTYSRTHKLFDEFVEVLNLPDICILMEIYPAREINTVGISSQDLADKIPNSRYCKTLEEVSNTLQKITEPGDLVITVGAGDIYKAGEMLIDESGVS